MYSATTVRTFVAPRIGQLLSFILVVWTRRSLVPIASVASTNRNESIAVTLHILIFTNPPLG